MRFCHNLAANSPCLSHCCWSMASALTVFDWGRSFCHLVIIISFYLVMEMTSGHMSVKSHYIVSVSRNTYKRCFFVVSKCGGRLLVLDLLLK